MNATSIFNLRFVPVTKSKIETPDRLLSRLTLQRIASATTLLSQAIGFFAVGMLMIENRHQSDLNGLSGGSSVAMAGGIGEILVRPVLLLALLFYCRFFARS